MIQSIDQEEDPRGVNALQKMDFSSKGTFCPKYEYISASEATKALDSSKRKINEIMEAGKNKHVVEFTHALQKVVKQDMMVSNMPKIRIKVIKNHRLHSLPTLSRDPNVPIPKDGVSVSQRWSKKQANLRSVFNELNNS
jgi:hypothetical protein